MSMGPTMSSLLFYAKAPCSCLGKFRLATAGQGTSVGDLRQFHREEGWRASLPY